MKTTNIFKKLHKFVCLTYKPPKEALKFKKYLKLPLWGLGGE
jgi:hypothetical protein